ICSRVGYSSPTISVTVRISTKGGREDVEATPAPARLSVVGALSGHEGRGCGPRVLPEGVRLREAHGRAGTGRQNGTRGDDLARVDDYVWGGPRVQNEGMALPAAGRSGNRLADQLVRLLRRRGRFVQPRRRGGRQGDQAGRKHVVWGSD